MSRGELVFGLDDAAVGLGLLDEFQLEFGGHSASLAASGRRVAYDTFDWRLHRAGLRLWVRRRGGGWQATLEREARVGAARGRELRVELPARPGLIADLPPGPLRSRLEPVMEIRRLIPRLEVELGGRQLAVVDEEAKTLCRVVLEQGRAKQPRRTAPWHPVAPRLRVAPLKGYERTRHLVTRFLEGRAGLHPAGESVFQTAADAVGLTPGSYSSKIDLDLDPATPAARAVAAVYRRLLEIMTANVEGVKADLDSEFLHDFRVSIRRTRVGLGQLKACLSAKEVEAFRTGFGWLGGITGPTRDLDVYRLKMPRYRGEIPEATRSHLDPLDEFLRRHQRQEQRKLSRALRSPRYRRLIDDWEGFLARVEDGEGWGPAGERAIGEVASARIWKVYRRVLKKGRAIDRDGPADPIHRLRIDCKKLRYLIEFFRGLYPAKEIGLSIKALKVLQDNLGDFHDYEVQQASLVGFSRQMVGEDLAPVETLMAMGRLVERLEKGQELERELFHERFARFSDASTARHFQRLFRNRSQEPSRE